MPAVIPCKPPKAATVDPKPERQDVSSKSATESKPKTFKPIKKGDVSQIVNSTLGDKKGIYMDREGITLLIEALLSSLDEKYVRKDEVESVVLKTLQGMTINKANGNKK